MKEGGSVWTSFLDCGEIPEIERQSLAILRQNLKSKLDQTGFDMKRDGGITILQGTDKEAASNLLSKLAEYGLFVVPYGELESWLKPLNASGHGPNWLIEIFELMGEDPNSADFLKPEENDVWDFIYSIRRWFTDQSRKGIPQ